MNSDLSPPAKDSTLKNKKTYICGLRARIEYEPLSEYSTHSDRVTNIGYLLSWGVSALPVLIYYLMQRTLPVMKSSI